MGNLGLCRVKPRDKTYVYRFLPDLDIDIDVR